MGLTNHDEYAFLNIVMKLIHLLALTFALIGSVECAQWVQVWSDEFDGGNVNQNKWKFEYGNNGWGNNELQYYTDRKENARVEGGFLTITARKENYGSAAYTSTRMNTAGHFSIMYGKFEMRAKLPRGQGIWPAFWLLGDDIEKVGWPACGEIDIMEYIGKSPNTIFGSLHAPSYDVTANYNGSGFSDGFHTYAANWQPDYIEFSVDGKVYRTFHKSESGGHWPFENRKFFILLNLAVGGNWPGYPDGSTQFPQEFQVDYVRVFEMDWSAEEVLIEKFLN